MTEEELRKFDKETLVQFIFRERFWEDTIGKLTVIQERLRFESAMAKSKELLDEMDKLSGSRKLKDQIKWQQIYLRYQRLAKQTDKYLGIGNARK
jgi:hypothetical protein